MPYREITSYSDLSYTGFLDSCSKKKLLENGSAWVALDYPKGAPLSIHLEHDSIRCAGNTLMYNYGEDNSYHYYGYREIKKKEWWEDLVHYHSLHRFKIPKGKSIVIHGLIVSPQVSQSDHALACKTEYSPSVEFIALDISDVNSKYISYENYINFCEEFGIPVLPEIKTGGFKQLANMDLKGIDSKIWKELTGEHKKNNPLHRVILRPIQNLYNDTYNNRPIFIKNASYTYNLESLNVKHKDVDFQEFFLDVLNLIDKEDFKEIIPEGTMNKGYISKESGKQFSRVLKYVEDIYGIRTRETFSLSQWNKLQKEGLRKATRTLKDIKKEKEAA